MKSSIRLGRLFGIEIGAHISWLIIVVLVTLSLASYFSMTQSAWSPAMRWGASFLTAMLFFASVLAHELAHSLVAKRFGIPVRSITLFIFGGVSQIESEAKRPSEEFWIAIVGPLTSVAIGALASLLLLVAPMDTFVGAVAGWLAAVNIGLAIFNMVPGFPLDGGRVLRSLLWWKTADSRKATRIAAGVGQIVALLMILGGVWMYFRPGGDFGGLWLAFIGWFLLDAARASTSQVEVEEVLRGVTAADLMATDCPTVHADLPLSQFIEDYLLRTGQRCFLVTDGEMVLGMITAPDLKAIERSRWAQMRVADVMRPFDQVRWVAPNTTADRLLEIMAREKINQLPVVVGGRLLGLVSREQIINLLSSRMELAPGVGKTGRLPQPPRSEKKDQKPRVDHAA
jgi:Zn-dependent protease/predicted transcriptional regulator